MLPQGCGAANEAVRCRAGREGRAAHHAHEHGRVHGLVRGPVHPSHQLGPQPTLGRLHLPHLLVQEARLCHTADTLLGDSRDSDWAPDAMHAAAEGTGHMPPLHCSIPGQTQPQSPVGVQSLWWQSRAWLHKRSP